MQHKLLAYTLIGITGCTGCIGSRRNPPLRVEQIHATVTPAPKPAPSLFASEPSLTKDSQSLVETEGSEATTIRTVSHLQKEALISDAPETAPGDGALEEVADPMTQAIDINLPSALAYVGGEHPLVGFAQWRVREAYAQLDRAEAMWLPSIQSGFSYRRHDGNYQAVDGSIVDVNLNSFHYGLGVGAMAAGGPSRHGLVAEFHLADAIFQPKIAEKRAWAENHAATAVTNEQLLRVATAYIDLLDAHQDARIIDESRSRTADIAKLTNDYAAAGQGLRADADRLTTELILIESRTVGARERVAVASAALAQSMSIESCYEIRPLDVAVVPLELVSPQSDCASLVAMGLTTRPELKESQTLVAAACEAYKREKYAPFVPSVLLGFSSGGFGGGLGNNLDNVDGRYDVDALMAWEVRNLGFGEMAARRESSARVQQARYEKLRVMDQVAREVSESYSQITYRRQQIDITAKAIQTAQNSYDRNLERIRNGQGLPLEVLQSVQALELAQRAYLRSVIDHNRAQFQLQWALGWRVDSIVSDVAS